MAAKLPHGIKQNKKGFYLFDTRYKAKRVYNNTLALAKRQYYIYLNILGHTSDQAEAIIEEVKV